MTWIAQLGHVVAKDVRQARWILLVYGLVVIGVTISSLHAMEATRLPASAFAAVIVLFGMVIVAWLVQDDSPFRADAFWASRPFYPSAVLGAKGLIAIVFIVGVPAIGQGIALASNNVGGRFIAPMVLESVEIYALWLLAAMVTAARSFV